MRLPGWTLRCIQRLVLLASLFIASGAWADEPPHNKVKFDLPADEFPKAILEFYRQSKIEVLFLADDSLNLIHTKPVIGEYEPREALELMLQGTGLVYNFATDHSVSIKQVAPAEPPPPPPPRKAELHRGPIELVGFNELSSVTVTGSYIRGASDLKAPVIDVSPKELSYAPFPTVQDALYQSSPIISLDAPRADLGVNNNYNWGAGVNLRGLGVGATLVLVDGRRQPMSGATSDFVDVSNIPAAAVDHIEILPQGASAIYGSDAIAGVVNIILKDHFDGAQTQLHYGGTAGGLDNIVVSQLLGTHWTSGNVMLVYQYSDTTELPASARGYASYANKAPYGGSDYRSIYTDPANIVSSATLLPISGSAGGPISYENQLTDLALFPQETQHSVYAKAKQEVGIVELFADGRFTQRSTYRPALPLSNTWALGPENPFNPDPGAYTLVDYSFGKVFGPSTFSDETQNYVGTVGGRIQLGKDWQATLSETYGRERLYSNEYNIPNLGALDAALSSSNAATAFNPFGTMSQALLSSLWIDVPTHATSGIETTSLIADGPLLDLPTGEVKLAAGLERREESLSHSEGTQGATDALPVYGAYSRHVESAFTEIEVPLIGPDDPSNKHAVPRLELTLAGRYDHYSDFGGTTNPEFSIKWMPIDSLKLRASWGRSFRAPKLDDLYDSSNNASGLALLPDPLSSTGHALVLALQGDNPNLRPETAKSWSAGFDVVPELDPEFNFSLTYYSIDYSGQILTPGGGDPSAILTDGNEWAAVVTRNPTAAQIAAICNRPDYLGSVAACLASSPAAIVDTRVANLATTQTSGLDLNVRQKLSTDIGHFDFGLMGSYVFHFDQAVSSTSPSVDILNTFTNPLKFRLRTTAAWDEYLPEESGFGATLALNFTNAYKNPGSPLAPDINSLTTVDLQLRYHTAENSGWLGGMDFALNAVNVFNRSPPFADSLYGYDQSNVQPLGRVLGLTVTKKW